MTLRSRNIVLWSMCGLLLLFASGFIFLLFNVQPNNPAIQSALEKAVGKYLNNFWPILSSQPLVTLLYSGISIAGALLLTLTFIINFRRISSPELFFLCLFWFALACQSVRAANLYFIQEGHSIQLFLLTTRIFYFGYLLSTICVVCISLFLAGIKIQHQGVLLGIALAVSFIVPYLLPIDIGTFRQGFTYLNAQSIAVEPIVLALGSIACLNVALQAGLKKDLRTGLLIIPFGLMIAGHELLYVIHGLISVVVAWLLIVAATVWLVNRFVRNYLWY